MFMELYQTTIVLSVSTTKIDYDNPVYRFTKTYRKVDYY